MPRADICQQDREEKGCHYRADLGESRGKSGAHAADLCGKDLARQKVGLGAGTEIRHEIEQHEAEKDQDRLSRTGNVGRKRRQEEAGGAADEAEDLQPDPADLVGEQDREDDPDN